MTKHIFHDVYPVDKLPEWQPGAYVINTDKHNEPGEHWLAVYNKEFFNSSGEPPVDDYLHTFLGDNYEFNTMALQNPLSNACGFYCCYYILKRARDISAEAILQTLKQSDSDFVVKRYIYDRYDYLLQ